ncbi:MAG: hypothetical protein WCH39_00290 [Schlesneria sp.]
MNTMLLQSIIGIFMIVFVTTSVADDVPTTDASRIVALDLQEIIQAAATRYVYFAAEDIISNRPTRQGWSRELMTEQARLMEDLREWSVHSEVLQTLIAHPDPKFRVLVLGALYVSEDPLQLPVIASLVDDSSTAFKHVPFSLNSSGMRGNVGKTTGDPQSVGEVAQSMVAAYLGPALKHHPTGFAEYWNARKDRNTCAGWFLIRLQRATRNQTPLQPRYQRDIQRVIDDLNALPVGERAWTQVFLRCRSFGDIEKYLTNEACIASLKDVGHDQIVKLLKREQFCADPDLRLDTMGSAGDTLHSWMSHFVLRRTRMLLRVEDVPTLLACEEIQRKTPLLGATPYWAAAAAELMNDTDPAAARQIIVGALGRFPLSGILGGREQSVLIGMLWRLYGTQNQQTIVDWFYESQALAIERKSDQSNHGPQDFLGIVGVARRPDTNELLSGLVHDSRFNQTDWATLKALIDLASEELPMPLVDRSEIYNSNLRLPGDDDLKQKIFADWRKKLISHYSR